MSEQEAEQELDDNIRKIIGDEDWKYTEQPHELMYLIASYTAKQVLEAEKTTYDIAFKDGINHATMNKSVELAVLDGRIKELNLIWNGTNNNVAGDYVARNLSFADVLLYIEKRRTKLEQARKDLEKEDKT